VEENREQNMHRSIVDPRSWADELLEGESEEEVDGKRASPTLSIGVPHKSGRQPISERKSVQARGTTGWKRIQEVNRRL
jgi:hypothetical protein